MLKKFHLQFDPLEFVLTNTRGRKGAHTLRFKKRLGKQSGWDIASYIARYNHMDDISFYRLISPSIFSESIILDETVEITPAEVSKKSRL